MGAAQAVGTQHKALLQPQPHFLGMKMPEHSQVLDRLGVQPWAHTGPKAEPGDQPLADSHRAGPLEAPPKPSASATGKRTDYLM